MSDQVVLAAAPLGAIGGLLALLGAVRQQGVELHLNPAEPHN